MLSSPGCGRGASAPGSGASAALSSLSPWASLAGSPARLMSAAFVEAARARAPNYVEAASRRSCAASSLGSCPRRGGPASSGLLVLLCVKVLDASRWTRCDVCDAGAALRGRGAIDFSHCAQRQSTLPASVASLAASKLIYPEPSGVLRNVWGAGVAAQNLKTRASMLLLPANARAYAQTALFIACASARLLF